MQHTLTFSITSQATVFIDEFEEDSPEKAYIEVNVRPLINGQVLTNQYIFDVVTLLIAGHTQGSVDLFTCSCGEAGCAGIHDEMTINVLDTTIEWVFPEEPFRTVLNSHFFESNAPLVLRFDKSMYLTELQQLRAYLLDFEKHQQLPVVLPPNSHPDTNLTLEVLLTERAHQHYTYLEGQRLYAEQFGALMQREIVILFSDASEFVISSCNMAEIIAEQHSENTHYLDDIAIPTLLGEDSGWKALCLQHAFEVFEYCAYWRNAPDYSEAYFKARMPQFEFDWQHGKVELLMQNQT